MGYSVKIGMTFDALPGAYPLPEKHQWRVTLRMSAWTAELAEKLLHLLHNENFLTESLERLHAAPSPHATPTRANTARRLHGYLLPLLMKAVGGQLSWLSVLVEDSRGLGAEYTDRLGA